MGALNLGVIGEVELLNPKEPEYPSPLNGFLFQANNSFSGRMNVRLFIERDIPDIKGLQVPTPEV